jgi:hypothetical protein
MPAIINMPTTTRGRKGITIEEVNEYANLLESLERGQAIVVDDSESTSYETSYARGERVRIGLEKHLGWTREAILVRGVKNADGKFVAIIANK